MTSAYREAGNPSFLRHKAQAKTGHIVCRMQGTAAKQTNIKSYQCNQGLKETAPESSVLLPKDTKAFHAMPRAAGFESGAVASFVANSNKHQPLEKKWGEATAIMAFERSMNSKRKND